MLNQLEISGIKDPYANSAEKGWDIVDASLLDQDVTLETDVVIVGTGSGGGTTAEVLSQAGLKVILIEEGMLKSSDQFTLDEFEGYTDLLQEGGIRNTKDGGIFLAQGRNVGGGTTVNWCSTFRTPEKTLELWASEYGLKNCSVEEMQPHFQHMEKRLNVAKWSVANRNNEVIKDGAEKLGYHWDYIPRNVYGCWNIGYCGVGCPVDAKKSMLVTTIPASLDEGSKLIHRAKVQRLSVQGDKVMGIHAIAMKQDNSGGTGKTIEIRARHTVLAAGAVNTPGILLRSKAPDPFGLIGKRTFLHPVTNSYGQFEEPIDPYYGAPQSVYSDEFTWKAGLDGPMGYKIEAIPLLPGVYSILTGTHGKQLDEDMNRLGNTRGMMAFLRDGFHEDSPGGSVELSEGGSAILDYPITDYLRDGIRRSLITMAELQFAAGATQVRSAHLDARWVNTFEKAKAVINKLDLDAGRVSLSSAHVMGGCAMGEDAEVSVTDSSGRYHHLEQLSVHDGSLFPTSLGANPQMSIFGFARKFSIDLVKELGSVTNNVISST